MTYQSPPRHLLTPITLGERFFPDGAPCGFYPDANGKLHPNVTSVLSNKYPFDIKKWAQYEPAGFDCKAAGEAAAKAGTAVHGVLERYLLGKDISGYDRTLATWVEPLLASVSQASAVVGVELPLRNEIDGMAYAGSCDAVLLAPDGELVVVDFKTRRDVSYKKDEPNRPNLRHLAKQKAQTACYLSTINAVYGAQLHKPISRATLLFAVPGLEKSMPVTISGIELDRYIQEWHDCLSSFYEAHGEAIQQAQQSYDQKRQRGLAA